MQVHYSLDNITEIKNPVVTTGSFDGVHLGHRTIIRRLRKLAKDISGETVLVTFHPHPRKVLYPENQGKEMLLICSPEEKIILLEETGLDHLVVINFTKKFATMSAEDFVEQILIGKLHAKMIVIGFNHHFGNGRRGDLEYLFRLGRIHGFEVEEIPGQDVQQDSVSSTKIRKALLEGEIQRASAYLDHFYFIQGRFTMQKGEPDIRVTKLHLLEIEDKTKLIPPNGIYAVTIQGNGITERGMIVISDTSINSIPHSPALRMEICAFENSEYFLDETVIVFVHKQILPVYGAISSMLVEESVREIKELIF